MPGVVGVPAHNKIYFGVNGFGSYISENNQKILLKHKKSYLPSHTYAYPQLFLGMIAHTLLKNQELIQKILILVLMLFVKNKKKNVPLVKLFTNHQKKNFLLLKLKNVIKEF